MMSWRVLLFVVLVATIASALPSKLPSPKITSSSNEQQTDDREASSAISSTENIEVLNNERAEEKSVGDDSIEKKSAADKIVAGVEEVSSLVPSQSEDQDAKQGTSEETGQSVAEDADQNKDHPADEDPSNDSEQKTKQDADNDEDQFADQNSSKDSVQDTDQNAFRDAYQEEDEDQYTKDSNDIEENIIPTEEYENALAEVPEVLSTLNDPDTYNWLLSYLPIKLPKLPKTFQLKSEYKDFLYGYLESANKVVVGNDHVRYAVNSANWLFKGYNTSEVSLYFKLALDAFQDFYENRDGIALRDRLDRVLLDFGDEEFRRSTLDRLDWWMPFGTVLWGPVSHVSLKMGWTSAEEQSTRHSTAPHTYKKWSDTLNEYISKGQTWSSRANTLLLSTGRHLLPNIDFATVSDQTPTTLLTCAGCASNKSHLNVNLANIFFFLSALITPLMLLALPIALAIWFAIGYGMKFKFLGNAYSSNGIGLGYGGGGYGGGGAYSYSSEGYDDSYRRADDSSFLVRLTENVGSMLADAFINWGDSGDEHQDVIRTRYSNEYPVAGPKRRPESFGGGGTRQGSKTKYRRKSKPKTETIYYDEYEEEYYVDDQVIT